MALQKLKLLTQEEYNNYGGNFGKFEHTDGQTAEQVFDDIQASILDRIDAFFRGKLTQLTEVLVDGETVWINNLDTKLLPNDLNRIKKAIYYEMESITVFDSYSSGQEGGQAQGSGVQYTSSGRTITAIRDELTHTATTELKKTDLYKDMRLAVRQVTGADLPGTWRIDAQFQDGVKVSSLPFGVVIVDEEDGSVTYYPESYNGDATTLMGAINENLEKIINLAEVADPEEVQRQLDEFRQELDAIIAQDSERKLLNKRDENPSTTIYVNTPHTMSFQDEENTYIKCTGSKIFLYPQFIEDQIQTTIECLANTATLLEKWVRVYWTDDAGALKYSEVKITEMVYIPDDTNEQNLEGEYNNIHTLKRDQLLDAMEADNAPANYEFSTNDYYEIILRVPTGDTGGAGLQVLSLRSSENSIVRVVDAIESFIAGKLYKANQATDFASGNAGAKVDRSNSVEITETLPTNFGTGDGYITIEMPLAIINDVTGSLELKTNIDQAYHPVRKGKENNEYLKPQEIIGKTIRVVWSPTEAVYICIEYDALPTIFYDWIPSDPVSNLKVGRHYRNKINEWVFTQQTLNEYTNATGEFGQTIQIIQATCTNEFTIGSEQFHYFELSGTFKTFSNTMGKEYMVTGRILVYKENGSAVAFLWGEQAGSSRNIDPIVWEAGTTHSWTELPSGAYRVNFEHINSSSSDGITIGLNGDLGSTTADYFSAGLYSSFSNFGASNYDTTSTIFGNSFRRDCTIEVGRTQCYSKYLNGDSSYLASNTLICQSKWMTNSLITVSTSYDLVFWPIAGVRSDSMLIMSAIKKEAQINTATQLNMTTTLSLTDKQKTLLEEMKKKRTEWENKIKGIDNTVST